MQVTKKCARYYYLLCLVCLVICLFCSIEWLVDLQFISREIRLLGCLHYHHKMAALNASAMQDSVVLISDICEKKLRVGNMAAFLIW
jgi:hypothetical protein